MNPKPNDLPTQDDIPKIKRRTNHKKTLAGGILITFMTFFATSALLLLFALIFAPQLSNALWRTDETQQALYGTSAAVNNAQIIVDMTSTALAVQAGDQQVILDNLTQREALLDAKQADLDATGEAISAAIVATQTAEVVMNEQQRTQAAANYSQTQSAIGQQSTAIAIDATSTQLALDNSPRLTPTLDVRPFVLRDTIEFRAHPANLCNWQGIAGTVVNMQGFPTGTGVMQVRLLSSGIDQVVPIGENLDLGASYNWAFKVADGINNQRYFVRLEDLSGNVLSPLLDVVFKDSCTQNLAIMTFAQVDVMGN